MAADPFTDPGSPCCLAGRADEVRRRSCESSRTGTATEDHRAFEAGCLDDCVHCDRVDGPETAARQTSHQGREQEPRQPSRQEDVAHARDVRQEWYWERDDVAERTCA